MNNRPARRYYHRPPCLFERSEVLRSWIAIVVVSLLAAPQPGLAASEEVDFAREILPILSDNCFRCHGPDAGTREADLRLDLPDPTQGPLAPRDGYSVIAPGDVEESVLMMRLTSDDDDVRMPPANTNKHLTPQQIDLLKRWIEQGAPWGKHWAYEKPVRPDLPAVLDKSWPRNAIDRFILARLEREGIEPSPEADHATLLRRAALDLIGLPPTIDVVASRDPYEAQIERLLASKHFGERQARHWLDNARYADSNGYSHDFPRSIWPYRDWVINALNADMPFDRFTIEQLAGDLLADATLEQKIATGFHRNTQINTEGGIDPEQFRIESIVDRVGTTGTVFLGLTVACAQCHDHKFDPISQKEYFQLFAFLNNADEPKLKVTGITDPAQIAALEERIEQLDTAINEKLAAWEASLTDAQRATLKPAAREALALKPADRYAKHRKAIEAALRSADNDFGAMADDVAAVRKQLTEGVTTLVMAERTGAPRTTNIHIKGDFTRPGEEVLPGVPAILHGLKAQDPSRPTRMDLAKWIVDPQNPLTARVVVNRIWQQYFGRGIVETENDFGSQGIAPTHPQLLDYLATELIANDWSLKHIHRLIVTSATYRQSSNARPDLDTIDPYNRLLARQSRVRLEAEIVRDVALAASGLLNDKVGGPSVFPPIPDGVMGLGQVKHQWRTSTGPDRYRRGMYTFTFRNSLHPALATFDAPDAIAACTRRIRSNTPLQALNLLNDAAWMEFSHALAARVKHDLPEAGEDKQIAYAFRLVTSRVPNEDERAILVELLDRTRAEGGDDDLAWTLVARTILNLDEAITRE